MKFLRAPAPPIKSRRAKFRDSNTRAKLCRAINAPVLEVCPRPSRDDANLRAAAPREPPSGRRLTNLVEPLDLARLFGRAALSGPSREIDFLMRGLYAPDRLNLLNILSGGREPLCVGRGRYYCAGFPVFPASINATLQWNRFE